MSKRTGVRDRLVSALQASAAKVARHESMYDRAREGRDRLILEAHAAGLSGAEIAKLTGLTPARVSQVIGGTE